MSWYLVLGLGLVEERAFLEGEEVGGPGAEQRAVHRAVASGVRVHHRHVRHERPRSGVLRHRGPVPREWP